MGQTNLMLALGPAHLAGEAIRDPVIGPPFAQERLHDRLRAMGVGHEDGAVAARSRALIRFVCTAKGSRLSPRILTNAPSLMSRPNRSFSTSLNRASGMPWTERR